jgi:hypothetical protein
MAQPRFRETLRKGSKKVWEAIFRHPFLREVGEGTLAGCGKTILRGLKCPNLSFRGRR